MDTPDRGKGGVHIAREKKTYPAEFKPRMVELVWAGRSPESLAKEFDPSANAIRKWATLADIDEGVRADGLTTTNPAIIYPTLVTGQMLIRQIRTLGPSIARYEEDIGKAMAKHPDAEVPECLPGAGQAVAPHLLGVRYHGAAPLLSK